MARYRERSFGVTKATETPDWFILTSSSAFVHEVRLARNLVMHDQFDALTSRPLAATSVAINAVA